MKEGKSMRNAFACTVAGGNFDPTFLPGLGVCLFAPNKHIKSSPESWEIRQDRKKRQKQQLFPKK